MADKYPSTACLQRIHHLCTGITQLAHPHEPVEVLCSCGCHFQSTGFCEEGRHGDCASWSSGGGRICDCPCHYRAAKAGLLELRTRVG